MDSKDEQCIQGITLIALITINYFIDSMKRSFQSVDQVDDVYVDHMSVTSEDTSSVILLTDRFENYENLNKEYIAFKEIGLLG